MKMSLRQRFLPALLAIALTPLAITAEAEPHAGQGMDREAMKERMEERRQEVYQRAELSDEQQAALNDAHAEYREAALELREAHQARVAEILSDDEQQALREAMHEMHAAYRQERNQGRLAQHAEDATAMEANEGTSE